MEIYYTDRAVRDLSRLPPQIQKRIAAKMRFYTEQHNPIKFAKKLILPELGEYRFRVGDYRIFFDIIGAKIFILKIAKRDQAY